MSKIYKRLPSDIQEIIDKELFGNRIRDKKKMVVHLKYKHSPLKIYNQLIEDFHISKNDKQLHFIFTEILPYTLFGKWNDEERFYDPTYYNKKKNFNDRIGDDNNPEPISFCCLISRYLRQFKKDCNNYKVSDNNYTEARDGFRLAIDGYLVDKVKSLNELQALCISLDINIFEMIQNFNDDFGEFELCDVLHSDKYPGVGFLINQLCSKINDTLRIFTYQNEDESDTE